MIFKAGDLVRVVAPENDLLKYMMQVEATGEVLRIRNGKVRVQIDGSESQDTEGYRAYSDFLPEQVTLLGASDSSSKGVTVEANSESYNTKQAIKQITVLENIKIRAKFSPVNSKDPFDDCTGELIIRNDGTISMSLLSKNFGASYNLTGSLHKGVGLVCDQYVGTGVSSSGRIAYSIARLSEDTFQGSWFEGSAKVPYQVLIERSER